MLFEWDEAKSQANLRKHGIDFRAAMLVFDDLAALTLPNDVIDGEQRWLTMGLVRGVQILVVVHTDRTRGNHVVTRIISARGATHGERRAYDRGFG